MEEEERGKVKRRERRAGHDVWEKDRRGTARRRVSGTTEKWRRKGNERRRMKEDEEAVEREEEEEHFYILLFSDRQTDRQRWTSIQTDREGERQNNSNVKRFSQQH